MIETALGLAIMLSSVLVVTGAGRWSLDPLVLGPIGERIAAFGRIGAPD